MLMHRMKDKTAARVPLLNRELGILAFNRRVLAQAADESVPLLERLRFLTIVSSNLDEFFEIRVAGIKEQIKLGITDPGPDGMTPKETLAIVTREARELVTQQFDLLNDVLLPQIAAAGIRFLRRGTWNDAQRAWVHDYFKREVLPVLTPIGLDPAHPFPRVYNKSLNLIVELEGRDAFGRGSRVAIVQAPRILPRAIRLPPSIAEGEYNFIYLTSVLHAHVNELFAGMTVKGAYQFRVTRNSDLFVDEEEIKNLRIALQSELLQRHFGDAVRLEVVEEISPAMIDYLLQQFQLDEQDLYHVDGPVNLYRLREVLTEIDRPDLKFPPFTPSVPAAIEVGDDDLFETIARQDVLLHHPYQSFNPVLDFIRSSANDPRVVAIKQTVYRTGAVSELMQILLDAARAGKEVTVVVELLARFDEEANLNWAAQLEAVGAHVVYGVVGHKTHAKMALIVRREPGPDGTVLKRYAHLGTGNYHSSTARQYTDFGLLTAKENVCSDVNEVFQQLTGLGRAGRLKHVWQSPFTLHKRMVEAIRNEARTCVRGPPGADRRQDECAPRALDHRRALRGVEGGREDRPDRPRDLRPAAWRRGIVREHPRSLDRRAIPRALAHFLVQQRWRRQRMAVIRGLDGPQFLPPHRARFSRARRGPQAPRDPRGPETLPRRQLPELEHGRRGRLPAADAEGRQSLFRAGRAARAPVRYRVKRGRAPLKGTHPFISRGDRPLREYEGARPLQS